MLGGWEWIIILAVVLLVFGVGRIGKLGGELGRSISEFQKGLRQGQKEVDVADSSEEKSA